MELLDKEWKEFFLHEIFEITATKSGIDKNKLNREIGSIPYITRSEKNNGLDSFISIQDDRYETDERNVITIGLDTQTVFYQSKKFYTGQNIQILNSPQLNENVAYFLIPLIKTQMVKFNWGGNGATLTRLKRCKIFLPINKYSEPDFAFMENYMISQKRLKQIKYDTYIRKRLRNLGNRNKIPSLEEKKWKEFFIEDIAEIISGCDIYESERVNGSIPYVTATANQNGIGYFVNNVNVTLEDNCLSVNRNGSVGYSFYHPYKSLFSNDCRKLRLKHPNKHVGLFISRQITAQKEKYGYGYKMGTGRLKRQKIMLPINEETEQPDYTYIEKYMKNLEIEKLTKYIEYIN